MVATFHTAPELGENHAGWADYRLGSPGIFEENVSSIAREWVTYH